MIGFFLFWHIFILNPIRNCLFYFYIKGLRCGIEVFCKVQNHSLSFLVGIGGDAGAGKTVLSRVFVDIFSPQKGRIIHGNDMHKWKKGPEKWQECIHLNSKANDLHKEVDFLKKISMNNFSCLEDLAKISQRIGNNFPYVRGGAGNTSIKVTSYDMAIKSVRDLVIFLTVDVRTVLCIRPQDQEDVLMQIYVLTERDRLLVLHSHSV